MSSIRFRLVKAGDPDHPVRVFPIWREEGRLRFREGCFSEPLPFSGPIEALSTADLPAWLLAQELPLDMLPVQTARGACRLEAVREIYKAATRVYGSPSPTATDAEPAEGA